VIAVVAGPNRLAYPNVPFTPTPTGTYRPRETWTPTPPGFELTEEPGTDPHATRTPRPSVTPTVTRYTATRTPLTLTPAVTRTPIYAMR
jgi:hypothetical protein